MLTATITDVSTKVSIIIPFRSSLLHLSNAILQLLVLISTIIDDLLGGYILDGLSDMQYTVSLACNTL